MNIFYELLRLCYTLLKISVDEGFHEISTTKSDFSSIASPLLNLEVWDQASTIEPRKVFEWEMDGR